ncbi:MAG: hypothetical protein ACOYW7_14430 [Nitrospirota bacterium]
MKRRNCCRLNLVTAAVLLFLSSLLCLQQAKADSCADCHTNLEKLKSLAPALPEPPKKLSEGEG